MKKLVLFDIDGTLVDSLGAGRRAILRAMEAYVGPENGAAHRVRFDGKTDPQIVGELLLAAGHSVEGPEQVARILDEYVAALARELGNGGPPPRAMPGVGDLLDRLDATGATVMGLLTGNVRAGAALKLRAAGLAPERFVVGAFGSDHADRPALPAIAVERAAAQFGRRWEGHEVVIIGDTPADVTCGEGVGARAIAVATGSYAVESLQAAGAYAVFPTLEQTAEVCEAILC